MRIIKPKKLNKGDLIGLISPASTPENSSTVEMGIMYLEKLGYKVLPGKNIHNNNGYLAGSDAERLEDLHEMFRRKDVKAVFCTRGGYGSPRLLDKIDYDLIRKNPKIFVGYSDITALQLAFLAKAGLITFAGPMLATDLSDHPDPYSEEIFWAMLTSNKKFGRVKLPEDQKLIALKKGAASGRITGGNLSLVAALTGTSYMPPMQDKILLLEDKAERPYRIDRMINQLKLAGILLKIKGLILGRFVDCVEHDPYSKTLTLGEVIEDYFTPFKIPSVYNFPFGHIEKKFTIPIGIQIRLNAAREFVEITENAVI